MSREQDQPFPSITRPSRWALSKNFIVSTTGFGIGSQLRKKVERSLSSEISNMGLNFVLQTSLLWTGTGARRTPFGSASESSTSSSCPRSRTWWRTRRCPTHSNTSCPCRFSTPRIRTKTSSLTRSSWTRAGPSTYAYSKTSAPSQTSIRAFRPGFIRFPNISFKGFTSSVFKELFC